ncbi:MAG: hypothetical protein K6G56_05650 [Clostridiales bacterium]|nr:hypothetical protein [Clostridiales bacterium]
MKRVCILYKKEDAEKNRVLIGKYFAALKDRGFIPGLVITDRLPGEAVLRMVSGCAFVINRGRDHELTRLLEGAGVRVTNPSVLTETANDKLTTFERLSPIVPMLETKLLPASGEPPLPYPFVAKPAGGHGGSGVTMIKNEAELEAYRALRLGKTVVQPVASELGRDMRVYVIGGKPVAAALRSSDSDFRSNFSLGGSAKIVPADSLGEDEKRIVRLVSLALPLHYAGVDIMRDRGRPILNEIEDPVGARMLFINTDIDPAALHVRFAAELFCENEQ